MTRRFRRRDPGYGATALAVASAAWALCAVVPSAAAPPAESPDAADLRFERVSLEEGVSHNLIYAIHEDADGLLWFGTMYGLVRHDGREWLPFRHDPSDPRSLSYDDIVCIAEDGERALWIGTYGGGVNRMDPVDQTFQRFLAAGPDSARLSDGIVWDLVVDSRGDVWVGTRAGLDRIDPRAGTVTRIPGTEGTVRALAVDASGALWLGGAELRRRDPDGTLTRFPHAAADTDTADAGTAGPGAAGTASIADILPAPDGTLWLATQGDGVVHVDPARGAVRSFRPSEAGAARPADWTSTLWRDPDGTLWFGSYAGVHRLDPATGAMTHWVHDPADPASPGGPNIVALLRDRSGVLWSGSYLHGLDRVAPPGTRFRTLGRDFAGPRGERHHSVTAFAEAADGTVWIGTEAGLIAREGPEGPFRTWGADPGDPDALPAWRVSALRVDAAGVVWVGTRGGLSRYDADRDTFRTWPVGPVNALEETRAGELWVGTAGGLLRFDRATGRTEPFVQDPADPRSLPDNMVLSLYEDARERLWVGTYAGIGRRAPGQHGFDRLAMDPQDPATLGNNYVYAFHETPDGTLWLGTGGGLDRYDEAAGRFTHIDRGSGLPNDVIASVLPGDEGRLWLATHRGLARFDPATGAIAAWDLSDGLQSNLFAPAAALRLRDGGLLFGGIGGYNVVRPSAIVEDLRPPPVVLTGFESRNGGRIRPAESVTLGPGDDFFRVTFAAIDTRRPERTTFRYRLEGLEDAWTDSGGRAEATYAGLPPGRYVFRVLGANGDGIWNEEGARLVVTVEPPFWRTAWFAGGVAALIVLAAWGFHRGRLRARTAHLREIEAARTEERDRVRRRTADDFHDELGHRLTKIGLFSDFIRRELTGVSPEADRWLARIAEETRRLCDDARDFVWSLGPGGETLFDLMNYLQRFGEELFDRTDVEFRVEGIREELGSVKLAMESRRHICSIFKEAMNNALRHAACSRVTLAARLAGDDFEITLSDDGKGWSSTSVRAGHGLKSMELRARKIAGTIRIASRPGAGSTITLNRRAVAPTAAHDPSFARRGRR